MCLVVLAFRAVEDAPLVVAANRDEFHARPTRDAGWWPDMPDVLAGRDLQAGGTWLGVHRSGRFATVTNYRDADAPRAGLESRGHLVTAFLCSGQSPLAFLRSIDVDAYAGFNLLLSDGDTLAYLSNRGGGLQELPPGIYGLSNATLDTPWEKVERSKQRLACLADEDKVNETELLRLLADRKLGPASEAESGH
ncbi:MAG: NRDE family protein, partial [Woeseiaceae bacterium]